MLSGGVSGGGLHPGAPVWRSRGRPQTHGWIPWLWKLTGCGSWQWGRGCVCSGPPFPSVWRSPCWGTDPGVCRAQIPALPHLQPAIIKTIRHTEEVELKKIHIIHWVKEDIAARWYCICIGCYLPKHKQNRFSEETHSLSYHELERRFI